MLSAETINNLIGIDESYKAPIKLQTILNDSSKRVELFNQFLNKESEVGKFPIQLHNIETQNAIVKMFDFVEMQEDQVQEDINNLTNLKQTLLNQMMI